MTALSLRLPYVVYVAVGSVLLGVIMAHWFCEVPGQLSPPDMRAHEMMHGELEVPLLGAPQVDLSVEKDAMDGWNVHIVTRNFEFTPASVNTANVPNTGHAHLYLNGAKLARVYGPHFHLPDLGLGSHDMSVSLSANDHSYFVVGGSRVEARVTIEQP